MKFFISQPMRGKTTEQIKLERQEVIETLQKQGHEVINSIFTDSAPEEKDALHYLSLAVNAMSEADAVYFMKGWSAARSCKVEHFVALVYGKEALYQ